MPEDIVVIGAGGFGRETLDVIEAINAADHQSRWNVLGVIDDATGGKHLERLDARGYRYLGSIADNSTLLATTRHVTAIGDPTVRAAVDSAITGPLASALIHPTAVVGSRTTLGDGVVVCAGAQLSTNLVVGSNVHINPGAIVGHDAVIDELVSINPGAVVSGEVHIERAALVGAGAVILQGLSVGAGSRVGASACVTKNVPAGATVVGVPAR
ncbi:NeuD/PglB/VioB family sugar acetyltransferase [uncultured Microbacterium sp.]|uniref:NeuD/PglB/VioB family sugar acetyltransferase n=1 Tax=uncultured Microbacterium sp. TaxID=191216 RepID=UPI0028E521EA|nr:NeuD/PglB/VioB family sugar acetyltransferase [uncultured Microbacterium sp.]